MPEEIRIGTRGSALARRQAEIIRDLLRRRHPEESIALVIIETAGDRIRDLPISEIGDKAIFVRAIELALLEGEVDLAVHSLKDVPAESETPDLELVAYSEREDPRDVLISAREVPLDELPAGARVGTGSLRRRAQLLAERPDLRTLDIRGNVDTRLRKLDAGEYDAVLLAAAGMHRLGLGWRVTEYLPVERFVPDAGQGIIAVQARRDDRAGALAAGISSWTSSAAAAAERATVRVLGADCRSPVGAYGNVDGATMRIRGMAATEDGSRVLRQETAGPSSEAQALGAQLGRSLLLALSESRHRG